MRSVRRMLWHWVLLPVAVVLVAMQLVPYGWSHTNPPVTAEAPWPSERAHALARAACYDCHSNEARWPAYSYVAPFSWLVRRDVEQGRDTLNFSAWDGEGGDAADAVADGAMPPGKYKLLHPRARLSSSEAAELIAALRAMNGRSVGGGGGGGGEREDGGGGPNRGSG